MSTTKPDRSAKDLQAVLDTIAAMPDPYASIATRLHETIMAAGPKLKPRIWYGAPGYATGRSAGVLVFFRHEGNLISLGVSETASVEREPGSQLRPSAWFLDEWAEATAARVADIVRTAFS